MFKRIINAFRERLIEVKPETRSAVRDLHDRGDLLNVTFDGLDGRYTSTVVDMDRRHFAIDLPDTIVDLARLRRSRGVRIEAKPGGVTLRMDTTLRAVVNDAEPRIELRYPPELEFNQRRRHRRVRARWSGDTGVQIVNLDRQRFHGTLHDLSIDGLSVMLAQADGILSGQTLPFCHIRLPDGKSIGAAAEVRYVQRERSSGKTKVGLRLVSLAEEDRLKLVKTVDALVRKGG